MTNNELVNNTFDQTSTAESILLTIKFYFFLPTNKIFY